MVRRLLIVLMVIVPGPCLAQPVWETQCTPAGVWYGGSVVAYQMTIIPADPVGHYTVTFEGMYKNSVLNTAFSGRLVRRGHVYEGSLLQLSTGDPDFLNPPPIGKMPDLNVGWISIELQDCDTIKNTIQFFGVYLANSIWAPGVLWNATGKVPLIDAPDIDLLDILSGGAPIIESYHRLHNAVNRALLHKK